MKSIIQFVERQPAPSLLPILRSQQQGEILALLLGGPALELSLTEIAARAGAPQSSVHREIERAERAGLVTTRKVGNTRLARANTDSPYYAGLSEVLTRAFGVPAIVAQALAPVAGISAAYIYGSWAARHQGHTGQRPVGDIDVLILGALTGISSTALLAMSSSVSGIRCRQLSETRTGWNQERGRSTTRWLAARFYGWRLPRLFKPARRRTLQRAPHPAESIACLLKRPRRVGLGDRRGIRIEVLRRVPSPPEPLKRRLRESRNVFRRKALETPALNEEGNSPSASYRFTHG